jgi:CubicO group peptidase (beta-lactamase class C family)
MTQTTNQKKAPRNIRVKQLTTALLCIAATTLLYAKAPYMDPANDHENLGPRDELLTWTPEQQVASYRNMDLIGPTRTIAAGEYTLELPEQLRDLGEVELQIADGTLTVNEYFEKQSVAGLLVIKDGNIVFERYGLGNTEESLWVSFSVSKSVESMLVGAAIQDGYIKSVDEKVTDYLPRLKNSAYDQSTIRNILQMSSGVEWNEDYADPESDVSKVTWDTLGLNEYLRDKPRVAAPGEKFNYNTAEANLVGTLLRSAIGNNLSTYLSEKIWKPFGMEFDANWALTELGGGEFGGCCINASLRDYGRIGLFAMGNGLLADGAQVLTESWMAESITSSKGNPGYGYLWWLYEDETYRASGIFGQAIYINPKENIVIAMHSARSEASNRSAWALQNKLFEALTKAAIK